MTADAKKLITLLLGTLLLAGAAEAALSQDGTVTADVGQLIEITVTDATITDFAAEFAPVSGSESVQKSTTDYLEFSNAKSNVQSLWNYGMAVSFTRDSDGSVHTGSVNYQGTSSTLVDLVYVSQSNGGNFVPWKVVGTTGEATGYTNHANCGTPTYHGTLSVPYYNSAGVAQNAESLYYQVCDTATEIYISSTKNMLSADWAYIYTQAASGANAIASNYEVTIAGQDYVFYSAAGETTVTLRAGQHIGLEDSANTERLYALFKFPDGFPAGAFTATVTATTSDIVT